MIDKSPLTESNILTYAAWNYTQTNATWQDFLQSFSLFKSINYQMARDSWDLIENTIIILMNSFGKEAAIRMMIFCCPTDVYRRSLIHFLNVRLGYPYKLLELILRRDKHLHDVLLDFLKNTPEN